MCSILNIEFYFEQNTFHCIAVNDVRHAIDFKIIRLARVRFEFETPVLDYSELILLPFYKLVLPIQNE
jgi:hypothetical protein